MVEPDAANMVAAIAARRIVLIVHGYNNREDEAGKSYEDFYKEMANILPSTFMASVWEVYWPGYWQIKPFSIPAISWTSYSAKERVTPQIGRALAKHLDSVKDRFGLLTDVLFIAHSLGCRVTLETLRHLSRSRPLFVPGICLMAAAVPASMLERDLREAADLAKKRYILHSPADTVLRWAFRPGQFLAHPATWPEAVGRFGNPRTLWDRRHQNIVNTGLNHGEYYSGRPSRAASERSRTASTLGRLFGRALPMYPREADPYMVSWSLPLAAPPPVHQVAERKPW